MPSVPSLRRCAERHLLGDAVRSTTAVGDDEPGDADYLTSGEGGRDALEGLLVALGGRTTGQGTIAPPLHRVRLRYALGTLVPATSP